MSHQTVGSTWITEFADKFFPLPTTARHLRPELHGNPFLYLENARDLAEDTIAQEFVTAINGHGLAPEMELAYCGNRPGDATRIDGHRRNVDAAFYRFEQVPTNGRPEWASQVLPIVFDAYAETHQDPLNEHEDEVWEADAATRTKVLGRITSYAELVFQVQQRKALFMLLITSRRCRFMRCDRSNTIVTSAIDYFLEWEFFCEILWRISNRSDAQLGMDPSATRLYPGDPRFDQMDAAAEPNEGDVDPRERMIASEELPDSDSDTQFRYIRDTFRHSLQADWPRYKLEVPVGNSEMRSFLVAKPAFCANGLHGRGTRGYVALDTTTGRFVWLKDAWRVDCPGMRKEGDVLAQLNKAGIPNVPTLVCHEDIGDQQSFTAIWCQEGRYPLQADPDPSSTRTFPVSPSTKSRKRKRRDDDTEETLSLPKCRTTVDDLLLEGHSPLWTHRHYRLVVKEVCMPLSEFQYGRQLVGIIYDCLLAHEQAAIHPDTQLLHRDVSAGNILIYPRVVVESGNARMQWGGLLADWEMSTSVYRPGEDGRPSQRERMGTPQYMSVALLSHDPEPPSIVRIADELESFFHVLLYHAARYLPSNCDDHVIASYIDKYFDTYESDVDGFVYVCSDKKASTIKTGKLATNNGTVLKFNSPMDDLFGEVLAWFRARYLVADYTREARMQREETVQSGEKLPDQSSCSESEDGTLSFPFALPSLPSTTSHSRRRRAAVHNSAPTEEDRAFASYLEVHRYMTDLFREVFHNPCWRQERKRDRVPKGWMIRREDPELDMHPHGCKRRRIEGPQTGSDRGMVISALG